MIRIRQCKCRNCGQAPRRFWLITSPYFKETVTSFAQAVAIADAHTKLGVPS